MAEPREPLEVRVDHERRRRGSARASARRVELPDRDEEDDERGGAERRHGADRERARRQLARRGARIRRVDPASISRLSAIASERAPTIATVIQSRSWPDGNAVDGEERADVGEREREDRVLDLDRRAKRTAVPGARCRPHSGVGVVVGGSGIGKELKRVRERRAEHPVAVAAGARASRRG